MGEKDVMETGASCQVYCPRACRERRGRGRFWTLQVASSTWKPSHACANRSVDSTRTTMMTTMTTMSRKSPWLVLVASCWVEATAGITYVFGTYSSVLRSSLGYDQRHINRLSVAKDLGDTVGLAAGFLCKLLPTWLVLLLGALLILLGYGCLWLLVVHKIAALPFWLVCLMIFVGTNGCTFLDTAALVSSINTFTQSRGTVVGLLKGFKGLSGAIFNQVYTSFLAPDESSFILMLALGPAIIVLPLMFVLKPVHPASASGDAGNSRIFKVLYGISLILAGYMLCVSLVQDFRSVSDILNILFTVGLVLIVVLPIFAPVIASYFRSSLVKCAHCRSPLLETATTSDLEVEPSETSNEALLSRPGSSMSRLGKPHSKDPQLFETNRLVERGKLNLGGDFTLLNALQNCDFWLLFFCVCFGSGSGVTAINNLGQIAEAQGYQNVQVFVSLTNIWNFLGRLAGGYSSEYATRVYGLPRSVVLAGAQGIMSIGHIMLAMAWPSTIYVATLLVGAGYGAHWGIFPAILSEVFGLQNFSVLYGFLCMAIPAGSLVFSGLIAGSVYDWQARKQSASSDDSSLECTGSVCFEITFFIMMGVCLISAALSIVLAIRTRSLYHKLRGELSSKT